jgi:hypothetical protein
MPLAYFAVTAFNREARKAKNREGRKEWRATPPSQRLGHQPSYRMWVGILRLRKGLAL